jgi:AraC-like DNA-binding protein
VARERRIVDILLDQVQSVECVPLQLPHPLDARAVRVARILLANPADPRTFKQICKDCGAGKRTVQRLFLIDTKMTFTKWRQQLRLIHAMQLLGSGAKVTTAALESGYGSTSAFIAMFRKQLGATPTRYWAKTGNRI